MTAAGSTGNPLGFWDGENVHYTSSTGGCGGGQHDRRGLYALAITPADGQAAFDSFKNGGTNAHLTMATAGAWSNGASNTTLGTAS